MNIEELLGFLVKEYNLSYKYQEFTNCYGGNWIVQTYSFYNDSGCFTICFIPQKNELDFYYASQFSNERKDLCEKMIDICEIEPDIWDKHTKVGFFHRPFFWCNNKKILSALAEALRVHLSKDNNFFGIQV